MAYRISFKWLKNYMPRSLYGRAALILILPVITLQLGISVVFIQRHFERVTEQMTASIVLELQYLRDTVNEAPDVASAREVWFNTAHGPMAVQFLRSRVSASNPHQLLVWMVVLGVFMTLISYIYLRNQLRPIKRLAAASAEYGRGNVVPYNPSGANEVRAAGHAFLAMRSRIERQTQTRTMMLSGVSHDLRTPLTRLRLGLGLLDGDDVEPLVRDVDDMQHLLDAFLDFARGDAEGEAEPTDPIALAHLILADAKRMGQAVEAGEISGKGDISVRPMALRRALENLIGNALRYGAEARLSVMITPRAAVFCVEDDGPGIPVEQREDAVRPFTRLDPARNQDLGSGVGLGLAIVEDIARAHGGTLRLSDSEELGGLKAEIVLGR